MNSFFLVWNGWSFTHATSLIEKVHRDCFSARDFVADATTVVVQLEKNRLWIAETFHLPECQGRVALWIRSLCWAPRRSADGAQCRWQHTAQTWDLPPTKSESSYRWCDREECHSTTRWQCFCDEKRSALNHCGSVAFASTNTNTAGHCPPTNETPKKSDLKFEKYLLKLIWGEG